MFLKVFTVTLCSIPASSSERETPSFHTVVRGQNEPLLSDRALTRSRIGTRASFGLTVTTRWVDAKHGSRSATVPPSS